MAASVSSGVLCNIGKDRTSYWIDDFRENSAWLQAFYWLHCLVLAYQIFVMDVERQNLLNQRKNSSSYFWRL